MAEYLLVINEAQRILQEDPFDVGHDYDHHQAVVSNITNIVREERLMPDVDLNALIIAAWWHDYKRNDPKECDRLLTDTMKTAGFEETYIDKVLKIKNSHSFGSSQGSLEAKILYEADKLEYLSTTRIRNVRKAVENGDMHPEVEQKYVQAFGERISQVLANFTFSFCKNEAQKRIKALKKLSSESGPWFGVLDDML